MICTICLCYFLCNVPLALLLLSGAGTSLSYARALAESIFSLQYSLNFVIYAASNKQYREAYRLLLESLARRCCRSGQAVGQGVDIGLRDNARRGGRHEPKMSSSSKLSSSNPFSEDAQTART